MKRIIITLLLLICITKLPANADYIATQTFVVDASNTITIVTSGNLNSNIDGITGQLASILNINFNITTNADVNDIRLRAMVLDDTSTKHSAFYCTDTSPGTNVNMDLVLADQFSSKVTLSSIRDCQQAVSTPVLNPHTIAYPGAVTIDHSGTVQFIPNSLEGYFSANILTGETNLNMTLGTSTKSGTFDSDTAYDSADNYLVEIYLDNIPG